MVRGMPYCQRHIVQQNVEPLRSPGKVFADQSRDHFSLCDELARIELGHHALEHLVDDGRKDPLVVVLAEGSVNLRQRLDFWS
jgi:hypothetical protein